MGGSKSVFVVCLLGAQLLFGQAVLSTAQRGNVSSPPPEPTVAADALLPEIPSLPHGRPTLVGGSIGRLDRVRDQLTVNVFGGQKMKVLFDERTQVYRDGARASQRDLAPGQKIYVDTVLDGAKIFARSIRVITQSSTGQSQGQIIDFNRENGELLVRDELSREPLKLHVSSNTTISGQGQQTSAELASGALVSVEFQTEASGRREARQVSILAAPGTNFTFSGQVTFLDVHAGVLVLVDPRDKKRYEISFDPDHTPLAATLHEGSDVTVTAGFDGSRYLASAVNVNPAEK